MQSPLAAHHAPGANILGQKQTASFLQETLDEKTTDQKLTQMAEEVNVRAVAAGAR